MNFRYLPMTEADKEAMLETMGIQSTVELFADITDGVRLKNGLNLKKGLDEAQLKKELMIMANKNANLLQNSSFLGAGVYDHLIPSVVDHVISRSEFYTVYKPFIPVIYKGELQVLF